MEQQKKKLVHRKLMVFFNMHSTKPIFKIEHENNDYEPLQLTDASCRRLNEFIMTHMSLIEEIDVVTNLLTLYCPKVVYVEEREECKCKLPEETCSQCIKVGDEVYEIPY